MKVHVLYFAILRERMKADEADHEVQDGETVTQLAQRLLKDVCDQEFLDHSLMYGVNNAYVDADYKLCDGDEVSFIPPVAGG